MCGISGVSFKRDKKGRSSNSVKVFKELLEENTSRGKHSTGIVYLSPEYAQIQRGFATGEQVSEFIYSSTVDTGIIGHTRFATIGDRWNDENIHPFETDTLIGMHNGSIFNYKHLIRQFNLKVFGECDSEVVFRLICQEGIEALKFVYGTYMLVFVEKETPDIINIITNGSKPLVGVRNEDFFAFGSVADISFACMKNTMLAPKPGVLYKIQNGDIIQKDTVKGIQPMSEKEGELRYKVDFKNLRADYFLETVPVSRRIANPKVQTLPTKPYNIHKTSNNAHISSVEEEKKDERKILDFVVDKLVLGTSARKENIHILIDHLAVQTFSSPDQMTYVLKDYNTGIVPEFIPFGQTSNYTRALYWLERLIVSCVFANNVVITKKNLVKKDVSDQLFLEDVCEFLAVMFLGNNSKNKDALLSYIKEQLIDTKIIRPKVYTGTVNNNSVYYAMGAKAEKPLYEYETDDRAQSWGYAPYPFALYGGKKQLGKHFTTTQEFVDFRKKVSLYTENPLKDSVCELQRVLMFCLYLINEIVECTTNKGIFKESDISREFNVSAGKELFGEPREFLEKEINKIFSFSYDHAYLLNNISQGYLKLFVASPENPQTERKLYNGTDLYYNLFYGTTEEQRFDISCRIVEFIRKVSDGFRTMQRFYNDEDFEYVFEFPEKQILPWSFVERNA